MVNEIINQPLFKEETMKKKGFTLIELMVVVVIIGILAAIAIPNFMRMQQRAKEGSVKNNMHTLQLAVEDFATLNNGAYAGDDAAVTSETGDAIVDLLPGGVYSMNPFTGAVTNMTFTALGVGGDPKTGNTLADAPAGEIEYCSDGTAATGDAQKYAVHGGNADATDGVNLALILANY
jgi:type IV pilus assembly protein PilA